MSTLGKSEYYYHTTGIQSQFADMSGSHMSKGQDGVHIGDEQGAIDTADAGQSHLD